MDWNPNPRTNINASYNSKLQSANDYGLRINHRRRNSTWLISYSENITSVRQELLSSIRQGSLICDSDGSNCFVVEDNNPILEDDQIVFAINSPVSSLINDRFIQKSLTANVVFAKGKSTYTLGLFNREREFQTGSAPNEQDIGINLGWSIRLNSRTGGSISYNWSELEPDGSAKDTVNVLAMNLSRQISTNTTVSVALNASDRSSPDSSREFSEQSLGIGLVRNF